MNISTAVNSRTVTRAISLMLALFFTQSVTAENGALVNVTANTQSNNSAPTFLNYVQQQEKKEPSKPAELTNDNNGLGKKTPPQTKPSVPQYSVIIQQKDKTIRQLQAQLKAKTTAEGANSGDRKALLTKINDLQAKLNQATAENAKARSALNDKKVHAVQPDANESTKNALAAMTSEKQKIVAQLAALTTEKQALTTTLTAAQAKNKTEVAKLATATSMIRDLTAKLKASAEEKQALAAKLVATAPDRQDVASKLSASETEKQALETKLSAALADTQVLTAKLKTTTEEKQDVATKLATAMMEKLALTAKVDSFNLTRQQAINTENTLKLEAEKAKAQLQANTDEISQLKAKLVQTKTDDGGKSAALDLTKESQLQDYAIGTSMGDEALKVLSTRNTQGVKINQSIVLQGIMDTFSGKIALDETERNKALFDVSNKLFQNLNKIEKQAIGEGKKYQKTFSQQKGVLFKDGIYSRIDYAGKGKIHDNDIVTITIKEMLIDGTVINDMEAEGKVWSQELNKYPATFLGPIKRLSNHGVITVVIPPEQAYGSEGIPSKIPPGSTMVYTIRIVDVKAAEPQTAKKP
ncbi:FKBP-type peptidyl-prolyl cis-trans isomerase [Klebsiella sp. R390]|uniref:FKBP-type peptidyl-prolyl cis-trans isomerase n=1 Tax=Klebsiella sp. R390 TaxID=2755400 RepID=UPI003DAA1DC7